MNLFITLLENVNKSRTSANNVSLNEEKDKLGSVCVLFVFCKNIFEAHVK
jgi:hypothetical protein